MARSGPSTTDGMPMSDLDEAKQKLSEMVRSMNPQLVCKIPEETANGFFQIAITNNENTLYLPFPRMIFLTS